MHLLGRAISDFSLNLNKNLDLSKLGGSGFPLLLKNSRPCQQLDLTSRHLAGPCPQLMMSLVNLGKLGCTSSPDLLKTADLGKMFIPNANYFPERRESFSIEASPGTCCSSSIESMQPS